MGVFKLNVIMLSVKCLLNAFCISCLYKSLLLLAFLSPAKVQPEGHVFYWIHEMDSVNESNDYMSASGAKCSQYKGKILLACFRVYILFISVKRVHRGKVLNIFWEENRHQDHISNKIITAARPVLKCFIHSSNNLK